MRQTGKGKAPDFVLEVASPRTGRADYTDKRLGMSVTALRSTGGSTQETASTTMWGSAGRRQVRADSDRDATRGYASRIQRCAGAVCVLGRWAAAVLRPWYGELPSLPRRRARRKHSDTGSRERAGRLAAQARAAAAEARAEEERASRVAAEVHLEGLEAELRRLRGE